MAEQRSILGVFGRVGEVALAAPLFAIAPVVRSWHRWSGAADAEVGLGRGKAW